MKKKKEFEHSKHCLKAKEIIKKENKQYKCCKQNNQFPYCAREQIVISTLSNRFWAVALLTLY
jgi:hypothetical protein